MGKDVLDRILTGLEQYLEMEKLMGRERIDLAPNVWREVCDQAPPLKASPAPSIHPAEEKEKQKVSGALPLSRNHSPPPFI